MQVVFLFEMFDVIFVGLVKDFLVDVMYFVVWCVFFVFSEFNAGFVVWVFV